jgi:hypothetical protein
MKDFQGIYPNVLYLMVVVVVRALEVVVVVMMVVLYTYGHGGFGKRYISLV